MLAAIESGEFQPTRNTVLVIDEVSQVGPRPMLALLELQARTGMTIKALGCVSAPGFGADQRHIGL